MLSFNLLVFTLRLAEYVTGSEQKMCDGKGQSPMFSDFLAPLFVRSRVRFSRSLLLCCDVSRSSGE